MKRLVFTIVAGFIGGSGYDGELGPRQVEDAERAGLRRAAGELSQQNDRSRSNPGGLAASQDDQGLA